MVETKKPAVEKNEKLASGENSEATKATPTKASKPSKKTPARNMREIEIEKVVLHVGTTPEPNDVKKAVLLLETVSGTKVVNTHAKKRIAAWKIRPGMPIGAKVTLRGAKAKALLKRLLYALDFNLKEKQFTENGFAFGVKEYIDIEGTKYDPKLGMLGLEVCVTLTRPGFRVKQKRLRRGKVGGKHIISKEDAIQYASTKLRVKFGED